MRPPFAGMLQAKPDMPILLRPIAADMFNVDANLILNAARVSS